MESSQNKLSLTVKKTYKDMLSITKKEDKFYYLEIKKKYYKISEIKTIGMILLLISDIQNIFNSYNDNTNNSFDFISPYNVSLDEKTNQDFLKITYTHLDDVGVQNTKIIEKKNLHCFLKLEYYLNVLKINEFKQFNDQITADELKSIVSVKDSLEKFYELKGISDTNNYFNLKKMFTYVPAANGNIANLFINKGELFDNLKKEINNIKVKLENLYILEKSDKIIHYALIGIAALLVIVSISFFLTKKSNWNNKPENKETDEKIIQSNEVKETDEKIIQSNEVKETDKIN